MESKDKIQNKSVETYAEDMAKVIESDKGGLIIKIIHEQEKHDAEKKNLSPKSKKNKIFITISTVLVIIAFCLLIFFGILNKKIDTVNITPQYTPPIFIDQNYFQDINNLTKDQITQSILNEVNNTNVKVGGIEGIYLTENKQIIGFKRFIEIIEGNLDARSFSFIDDNFLIGTANEKTKTISPLTSSDQSDNQNRNLFILLKVRSFADIFPWLRSWEDKLFSDLHGFFRVSLSTDTKYLITKDFEDGLIANKNARILKDKDGNIVMMYVFADDNSVIVTNNEEITAEVILRLAGSQIKK